MRPCLLSKNFSGHNVRPQSEAGDEGGDAGTPVPAREYRFLNLLLRKDEFEALLGEGAWNSLYNNGVTPAMPAFTTFSKIKLDGEFVDSAATIKFGVASDEIKVDQGGKIRNATVKLDRKTGAATLDCTFVGVFPRDLKTLDLENFMGKTIDVALRLGPAVEVPDNAQSQLPMNPPQSNAA